MTAYFHHGEPGSAGRTLACLVLARGAGFFCDTNISWAGNGVAQSVSSIAAQAIKKPVSQLLDIDHPLSSKIPRVRPGRGAKDDTRLNGIEQNDEGPIQGCGLTERCHALTLTTWKYISAPKPNPAFTNWPRKAAGRPMTWSKTPWRGIWRKWPKYAICSTAATMTSRAAGQNPSTARKRLNVCAARAKSATPLN